jgi:hypothetical protein
MPAVGRALPRLLEILSRRLWQYAAQRYTSPDDYLRRRWHFTDRHARRLAVHQEVKATIAGADPLGPLPNERQARELAELPAAAQPAAWAAVQEGEERPTAERIRELRERAEAALPPEKRLADLPADEQADRIRQANDRVGRQARQTRQRDGARERLERIEEKCRSLRKLHAGLVDVADRADQDLDRYLQTVHSTTEAA